MVSCFAAGAADKLCILKSMLFNSHQTSLQQQEPDQPLHQRLSVNARQDAHRPSACLERVSECLAFRRSQQVRDTLLGSYIEMPNIAHVLPLGEVY